MTALNWVHHEALYGERLSFKEAVLLSDSPVNPTTGSLSLVI
jgi:hypothetical protein